MKIYKKRIAILAIVAVAWTGCAAPITRIHVQSFEINKPGLELGKAIDKLTGIMVDRGFDIKMTNKDAGIVTTEYKKFASMGTNPPFDYFLQIKAKVTVKGGDTVVRLSPIVKEQNRMNAAAFTEHELTYFVGDPGAIKYVESMKPSVGWRVLGQASFMNVVSDTAEAFGLTVEQVNQNVTKTDVPFTDPDRGLR